MHTQVSVLKQRQRSRMLPLHVCHPPGFIEFADQIPDSNRSKFQCCATRFMVCVMPSGVRWCYKIIEAKVGGVWIKIEIDGLSFCDDKVVLVERKPRITLAHVKELQNKVQNFR